MGVLQFMRSRVEGLFQSSGPEDELIDYVVDIIEPKLKLVKGYRNRLREPIEMCRAHCRAIVTEIPGPIKLRRNGYGSDPFQRAAFTKSETLDNLLNRADLVRSSASLKGTGRVALLTMTSREKTIFGRKQLGNMMVTETAMRAVTFTDHAIVGLSTTLASSRKALEKYTLDIVAEAVARELSEARTRLVDLNQRQERLRAMEKMFGTAKGAGMGCVFVPYDPEQSKKKKEVERLLAETEDQLVSARSRSETPEDWLTIAATCLSKPDDIVNMRLISLRLNWKNVLTDDPSEKADTITFATFTLADEMQREGVFVEFELK
jgi:hypothetical protein